MQTDETSKPDPSSLSVTEFTPDSALRNPRRLVADIRRDVVKGHPLAWRMFLRNIRGLYRQTLLGLFWAFLPPLANTALWVFLSAQGVTSFGEIIGSRYPVYVLAGMVLWQGFIEGLMAPITAVQSNRHILSKLRFPRESVLLVSVYEAFFNLSIRTLVLLPLMLLYGVTWGWLTLLVPVSAVALVLLGVGIGCYLMPIGMLYQDVARFLQVATPLWMIVTQIVYPPPENLEASPLNWANPASPLLLFSRDLLVLGQTEHLVSASIFAAAMIPILAIGLIVYRVSVPILVERVAT